MKFYKFLLLIVLALHSIAQAQETWKPFYFPSMPFSNPASMDPPDIVRTSDFSLWNAIVSLGGKFGRGGSGVNVGDGIVITAAHVLRDILGSADFASKAIPLSQLKLPSNFDLYKNGSVKKLARFTKSDQDFLSGRQPVPPFDVAIELNDWVVLKLPELLKRPSVKLNLQKVVPANLAGTTVWVAGYPESGNGGIFVSAGVLARNGAGKFFISQIQLKGGFSGGPVMTKDGTVIGLVNTYYPDFGNATFVPLSKITL